MASLTAQTYPEVEIILIDDGSTDSCPAICDEYAKKYANVRVIHQQNKGLSGARNAGIDAAKGDWLTFVDSDDTVSPQMSERLYCLAEETGANISSAAMADGKPTEPAMTPQKALAYLLRENTSLSTSACGKLFRKELFEQLRFPEGIWFEDYATVPLLFDRAKKIAHTGERLYHYRDENADSIMRAAFSDRRLEYFTVSDTIETFLSEKYPDLIPFARTRRTRYAISFYKQWAQAGGKTAAGKTLVRYIRKGILPYLLTSYKLTSKAYGLLIAVCPPLARRLFAR